MPTTASTATIRAWAHDAGLDVAERGRLKPEVLAAYAKANTVAKPKPAPAKKAAKTTVPKPPASKAPIRKAAVAKPITKIASEVQVSEVPRAAEDTRLADLQNAVAALTSRVAKLESSAKPKKFGRKG